MSIAICIDCMKITSELLEERHFSDDARHIHLPPGKTLHEDFSPSHQFVFDTDVNLIKWFCSNRNNTPYFANILDISSKPTLSNAISLAPLLHSLAYLTNSYILQLAHTSRFILLLTLTAGIWH